MRKVELMLFTKFEGENSQALLDTLNNQYKNLNKPKDYEKAIDEATLKRVRLESQLSSLKYRIVEEVHNLKDDHRKDQGHLTIESVQMEFKGGFLENIQVVGVESELIIDSLKGILYEILEEPFIKEALTERRVEFTNNYAIGFSRKMDEKVFDKISLWQSKGDKNGGSGQFINLSHVIKNYLEKNKNNRI